MTIINNFKTLNPPYSKTAKLTRNSFWKKIKLLVYKEGKLHNKRKNTQKSRKMYIIVCSKNNICLSECIFYKNKNKTETLYSLVRL